MENYSTTTNTTSSGSYPAPPNNNGKEKKQKGGNCSKRGNNGMKLSTDPQSVAARERRHRISDRFKILQSLVPGGSKMDTVSMLEEAINYVKFLKTQILLHQAIMNFVDDDPFLYLPQSVAGCSLPPQQQPNNPYSLDDNFVAGVLQPSIPPPYPDSFFLDDQVAMCHDPFDSN